MTKSCYHAPSTGKTSTNTPAACYSINQTWLFHLSTRTSDPDLKETPHLLRPRFLAAILLLAYPVGNFILPLPVPSIAPLLDPPSCTPHGCQLLQIGVPAVLAVWCRRRSTAAGLLLCQCNCALPTGHPLLTASHYHHRTGTRLLRPRARLLQRQLLRGDQLLRGNQRGRGVPGRRFRLRGRSYRFRYRFDE